MMSDEESRLRRGWSSCADFFGRWWREATGPLVGEVYTTVWHAVLRRIFLWIPVVVLFSALIGGVGLYFFTVWRAGDLARKAAVNARAGNIQMAWLQVMSASSLRGGSPEVQRTMVYVRSVADDPASPGLWDELAAKETLNAEEIEERARVAARFGNDAQFEAAMAALSASAGEEKTAAFRSERALRRGDLEQSISDARAAARSGDTAKRMQLLRLLLARHAPVLRAAVQPRAEELLGGEEIMALVDELQSTDQGNEAIALALGAFPQPADKQRAWAEAALSRLSPDNPALLPAAEYFVQSGAQQAPGIYRKLSPAFAGAAPGRQADFAMWLTRHGLAEESLLLITPKKAAKDPRAYEARGQAFAALGRWQDLLALSEAPADVYESMRLYFRGWAAKNLGKSGIAPKALADSLRAAVREGTVPQSLRALDSLGEGEIADAVIIEMCGAPDNAGSMFRVARDRFGRSGQFASMDSAWQAVSRAAPNSFSAQDYRRRADLLAGKAVSSAETAAAVAAAPADSSARFTHALALLREGRAAEALGVFDDIDILAESLPPGDQAIVVAIWAANGMNREAVGLRGTLDSALLEKEEYALMFP